MLLSRLDEIEKKGHMILYSLPSLNATIILFDLKNNQINLQNAIFIKPNTSELSDG